MWSVLAAIYLQFPVRTFEEKPHSLHPRDYTNLLKNGVVVSVCGLTLIVQMMDFRTKYLTFHFTMALSLNFFLFLHLPELAALMTHLQGIQRAYAVAHKLIEFIPMSAFISSLILTGRRRLCCSFFSILVAILSIYVSRLFN